MDVHILHICTWVSRILFIRPRARSKGIKSTVSEVPAYHRTASFWMPAEIPARTQCKLRGWGCCWSILATGIRWTRSRAAGRSGMWLAAARRRRMVASRRRRRRWWSPGSSPPYARASTRSSRVCASYISPPAAAGSCSSDSSTSSSSWSLSSSRPLSVSPSLTVWHSRRCMTTTSPARWTSGPAWFSWWWTPSIPRAAYNQINHNYAAREKGRSSIRR